MTPTANPYATVSADYPLSLAHTRYSLKNDMKKGTSLDVGLSLNAYTESQLWYMPESQLLRMYKSPDTNKKTKRDIERVLRDRFRLLPKETKEKLLERRKMEQHDGVWWPYKQMGRDALQTINSAFARTGYVFSQAVDLAVSLFTVPVVTAEPVFEAPQGIRDYPVGHPIYEMAPRYSVRDDQGQVIEVLSCEMEAYGNIDSLEQAEIIYLADFHGIGLIEKFYGAFAQKIIQYATADNILIRYEGYNIDTETYEMFSNIPVKSLDKKEDIMPYLNENENAEIALNMEAASTSFEAWKERFFL